MTLYTNQMHFESTDDSHVICRPIQCSPAIVRLHSTSSWAFRFSLIIYLTAFYCDRKNLKLILICLWPRDRMLWGCCTQGCREPILPTELRELPALCYLLISVSHLFGLHIFKSPVYTTGLCISFGSVNICFIYL